MIWAVHISDGVLNWPLLALGFALSGLLAVFASWRIREEEIPRVALLTAAFFVASSIHVKLGPTSVHLMLTGLVGVMLGWRAPLAVLIGVTLQALLIPHGGVTTIGVNALVEMVPALLAGIAFPWLVRLSRGVWSRGLLVAVSAAIWAVLGVFVVGLLLGNSWRSIVGLSESAGLVMQFGNLEPALDLLRSPWTIAGIALFALGCAWLQARQDGSPEFAAGVCLGAFAVIGTTLLTGGVLILDGAEQWSRFAQFVLLVHLPLAMLEGVILGVLVGYLARVKPELLRLSPVEFRMVTEPSSSSISRVLVGGVIGFSWLALPATGWAHGLEAGSKIDLQAKRVTIESWYETGDAPQKATAKVIRPDGSILAEGPLDDKGIFVFTYEVPEDLRVEIQAPGGHRAVVRLSARSLGASEPRASESIEDRSRWRDLMLGLTFLLALSAFVLSWRNTQRLAKLASSPTAQ